jgi:gas vesicle protein
MQHNSETIERMRGKSGLADMAKKVTDSVDKPQPFWGSIAAGALVGLVLGGGIALLYAPKSGRELRGDIEDAAEDLQAKAEATLDDVQEASIRLAERARTLIEETRENLVRSVEAGKEAYEQKRQEMTRELETQLHRSASENETAGSGV